MPSSTCASPHYFCVSLTRSASELIDLSSRVRRLVLRYTICRCVLLCGLPSLCSKFCSICFYFRYGNLRLFCCLDPCGAVVCKKFNACRAHISSSNAPYMSLALTGLAVCGLCSKLYNKLFKKHNPRQTLPEDVAPGERPKPKPVVTSYLLGWGVAVIVCGISGAINWVSYARENM
jgi:hypothetical protein